MHARSRIDETLIREEGKGNGDFFPFDLRDDVGIYLVISFSSLVSVTLTMTLFLC